MRIVEPMEFPLAWYNLLGWQKRRAGNQGNKRRPRYRDIVTAFDIETTRLPDIEQSVMYVWQWCFGSEFCVVGRTWDEFLWFVEQLTAHFDSEDRLVVYVHNLSYEFAFLRGVMRFETADVFPIKPRKILKASAGGLEFRCSYLHSNMSLAEYVSKMGAQHQKLSGEEFDYSKIRYPWTPLTARELEYCANDVIGLVEALTIEMEHDGDNLYTIPLTSTGYVRRDAKKAMRQVSKSFVVSQLPDLKTYELLREAFRGGDTHANRYFVGQTVENLHSADRSSSYPDIVCNEMFPLSEFFHVGHPMSADEVMRLITVRKKAVIMRVAISGLSLRDPFFPAPYLSRDKCRNIISGEYDNGRILEADYLETTITDIDLRIIVKDYHWADAVFFDVAYARYGKLPRPLIDETIKYYRVKTELKNVEGQEVYYTKSKNKLNSIYGMMAQDPVKEDILYQQDGALDKYGHLEYYVEDKSKSKQVILDESNRKAFLCYQWGCWVTAWARYRLREAIWIVIEQGGEFLYCDTDSVKYLGDINWSDYNRARIAASTQSGAFATDPAGEVHYMGVLEQEKDMLKFRTLGAKKYVYTTLDKNKKTGELEERLHVTIAGVAKSAGAAELEAAGGITAFHTGFRFEAAGGLEAIYNDAPEIGSIEVDGHRLEITANVCLRPSSYTLGVSADYDRLLRNRIYTIDF